MLESQWLAAVFVAAASSHVVFVRKEGGVYGALVNLGSWLLVTYGASNVINNSGGSSTAFASSAWVYFAGFLAVMAFVPLYYSALGEWRDDPREAGRQSTGEMPQVSAMAETARGPGGGLSGD